eukprot:GGOE01041202.1.p1 GENE.GGOE01041202.1~~GGOE01041202.1.p1  ORF type:complete len:800 (+),score=221.55 GGOE01041202.1:42-2402(+)
MAERINEALERMLPDLQFLQVHGLFSKKEIQDIVTKRRSFEYTLRSTSCTGRHWTRAIEYERTLQAVLEARTPDFLQNKHRLCILKRIRELYVRALWRFRSDLRTLKPLLQDYVAFLKAQQATPSISRLYTRIVRKYPMEIQFWVEAARWELLDNFNPVNARGLLQQALRLHSTTKAVHLAYFALELQFAELLLQSDVPNLMHEVAISRLPANVTEEFVRQLAARYGRVRRVQLGTKEAHTNGRQLKKGINGRQRYTVTAIVRMASDADCKKVKRWLHLNQMRFGKVRRRLLVKMHQSDRALWRLKADTSQSNAEAWNSILQGAVALLVYENATADGGPFAHDVDFHLQFLEECQRFDFSVEVQNELARRIYHRFPNNERCLFRYLGRKLHYFKNENASVNLLLSQKWRHDTQMQQMAITLSDTFDTIVCHAHQATQHHPGPRTWEAYIELLRIMRDMAPSPMQTQGMEERMRETQAQAMQAMLDGGTVLPVEEVTSHDDPDLEVRWYVPRRDATPRKRKVEALPEPAVKRVKTAESALALPFYLSTVQQMEAEGRWGECEAVLHRALEDHPRAVPVWLAFLQLTVRTHPAESRDAEFRRAITAVGSSLEGADLWSLFVRHKAAWAPLGPEGFATVRSLLQEAITHVLATPVPPAMANGSKEKSDALNTLCGQYLEYCDARGGAGGSQAACDWLLRHLGLPLAVFQRMIARQRARRGSDPAIVRHMFEVCLDRFGRQSTEIWLQYVEFEGATGQFQRVQLLHERATRCLADPRDFQHRFLQWQEGR